MSGAGFTPGPWEARDMNWATGSKHFIDGPNGILASTYSKQSSDHRAKAEVSANASLIAAAPDLYEALETVRKRVLTCSEYDRHDALCVIDAALAKARGEA